MNRILLQTCMRQKPYSAIHHLQTSSHLRPFSSQKPTQKTQSKRLDKALRVLDIIAPKTSSTTSRQSHLRLVQVFLQTNSIDVNAQKLSNDFASANPLDGLLTVFDEMLDSTVLNDKEDLIHLGVRVDATALSQAVSSCGSRRSLRGGVQYHCLAIRTGFVVNVYVGSSLISLYGKCGKLENAYRVFEEMPERNVVSWTAIIAGYAQEGLVDVCLELYSMMRNSISKPNDFTFTSLLSACTGSGALGQGRSAHSQTIQMGFDSYIHIANALISMYCKCGVVEDAFCIFETMGEKDVVSWNSMIAGYAQHGLVMQAIDLFEKMKTRRVKPDAITFLGVLSSCRHAGLVNEGRLYYNSMLEHGVKPELDHYSCVVDLLGRAGLLEEARNFVEKMPIYPNAVIWGSLLSSCRLHGSVWIGIQAAEGRLLLEPGCAATHVQLANLFASAGWWDHVARVRKLMKDKGLKTSTGYSWIEIKNEVYRFRAEDRSNTRMTEVLAVVDSLGDHMRTLGCVPEVYDEEVDGVLYAMI